MDTTPPSHSKGRQLVQTGAEVLLNAVPYAGGSAAVVLVAALDHKLNKRREQWFTELAEAVEELPERLDGFDPDALAENDAFADAVVTAPTDRRPHLAEGEARSVAQRCPQLPVSNSS